eukprot:m.57334 g.57334  ORF g.57334 m.57334 type:complete len:306 (-) comp11099_c0_seq2:1120-2037(-)
MADSDIPLPVKFGTAGLGGVMSWAIVHPFNTSAVRMNLQEGKPVSFPKFLAQTVREKGFVSLYDGVGAGMIRQIFYATSRFGLFEVFRDELTKKTLFSPVGEVSALDRTVAGLSSGAMAAYISCPAEVSLVRMSNDKTLPVESRRNYTSVVNAAVRIAKEDGISAFWRGSTPFVQRAMLVGVTQVGTFDQGKQFYENQLGIKRGTIPNVFCASMTSGLLYSLITMPFESAKNLMAFQKPDKETGKLLYRSTFQTFGLVVRTKGILALWNGFLPYYGRCGGHTVFMFIFVEYMRKMYRNSNSKNIE